MFNRFQQWFRRLLQRPQEKGPVVVKHHRFSFCESVGASSVSPWHIRRLDAAGRKLGGGITTPSLCGRVTRGWDLGVSIHDHLLATACRDCVTVYKEQEHAA